MLRSRCTHAFSAAVSPTSTTKRFLTIGWTTVQRASRMLIPLSAKVRDGSSSSRERLQDRPRDTECCLLVAKLEVAQRLVVGQFAIVPEFALIAGKETPS